MNFCIQKSNNTGTCASAKIHQSELLKIQFLPRNVLYVTINSSCRLSTSLLRHPVRKSSRLTGVAGVSFSIMQLKPKCTYGGLFPSTP